MPIPNQMAGYTFRLRDIRATPFPNQLLEEVVRLPETQARIVCHIVRSTLGWQAARPGERRSSVLMTYAELRRAVGVASKVAVPRAVSGLVNRGMLEVLTVDGNALLASEQRYRAHRPLRYRLARAWVEALGPGDVDNPVDKGK